MEPELLATLRTKRPLVVNYANFVTPGFVANGLNALGASPIMTSAPEEADALMRVADALVINLGTINAADQPLVTALATAAAAHHRPIVLDPVAAGATAYRLGSAKRLLADFPITVIRGNASEVAALIGAAATAKGIDAGTLSDEPAALAATCAAQYHCVTVISGAVDHISDGSASAAVYNETPLLPAVVGSGDLLSSLIGAYLGTTTDPFDAAVTACATLGVTGERAASDLTPLQPGTFATRLLDGLAQLDPIDLHTSTRYEEARHA
ncbi:hydroxyethylthiazole kinase [Lacticaseibacillus absianus]|uniref:hydroxyethylthiazole kinase n=1 Tax=Lacticaseibacillus absianus TaxID=2729623 RepID=UPI0015CD6D81|nr:hydroxyethylthiazole kinase [Lacticaseibacillus absianus]